jgi:hypothetical protein
MTAPADPRLGTVLTESALKAAVDKTELPTGVHLEPTYLKILSAASGLVEEEVKQRLSNGDDGLYQARATTKRLVFEKLNPIPPEVLLQKAKARQEALDAGKEKATP